MSLSTDELSLPQVIIVLSLLQAEADKKASKESTKDRPTEWKLSDLRQRLTSMGLIGRVATGGSKTFEDTKKDFMLELMDLIENNGLNLNQEILTINLNEHSGRSLERKAMHHPWTKFFYGVSDVIVEYNKTHPHP